MRQYRGKRKDNGEWVYGFYLLDEQHSIPRHCIWYREVVGDFIGNAIIEVDPATVGQYTGLRDKNGREIYEGDFVRVRFSFDDMVDFAVKLNQETARFVFECTEEQLGAEDIDSDQCEVIGNIFEHPHLLEAAHD
jgi:uncharacterized phage protein (TIGR01671 family)